MTDFTIAHSDIVDQHPDILINLFYHLVDYDFRNGFFTDESSIHDMESCGFTDDDYREVARNYQETCPVDISYRESEKYYRRLIAQKFDDMIISRFQHAYGLKIDASLHLLKDFVILLKNSYPERDWQKENIFILKTFDNRLLREEKEISDKANDKISGNKVINFPLRKKPTPEEIKEGFNWYLIANELKISFGEARKIADANRDRKYAGMRYEPYMPD